MSERSLDGATAVVTGVTSGIGLALARRLAGAGATVVGLARSEPKLAAVAAELGARFRPVTVDLGAADARGRSFAALAGSLASVDLVVLNAAEVVYEPPTALPPARWRSLFEVNVLAGIELVHGLRPRLSRGGHVVCVSSVTARFAANARFSPYATTKAALERFCDGLRQELDPAGIKVSLVAPGLVDTPIYDKVAGFEKTRQKISEQIPTWLRADDVADAIVWLVTRPAHVVVSELSLLPQGQTR